MLTGKWPEFAPEIENPVAAKMKAALELATGEVSQDMANEWPFAVDLLRKLLVFGPALRLSAREALAHQWFAETSDGPNKVEASKYTSIRDLSKKSERYFWEPPSRKNRIAAICKCFLTGKR
jgi:serine/threonine protein kinase